MVGCGRVTEPLSRISTRNLSLQQIYGEFEAAHQLSKESKVAVLPDNVGPSRNHADGDESQI